MQRALYNRKVEKQTLIPSHAVVKAVLQNFYPRNRIVARLNYPLNSVLSFPFSLDVASWLFLFERMWAEVVMLLLSLVHKAPKTPLQVLPSIAWVRMTIISDIIIVHLGPWMTFIHSTIYIECFICARYHSFIQQLYWMCYIYWVLYGSNNL